MSFKHPVGFGVEGGEVIEMDRRNFCSHSSGTVILGSVRFNRSSGDLAHLQSGAAPLNQFRMQCQPRN
jgi:hypothetical protein